MGLAGALPLLLFVSTAAASQHKRCTNSDSFYFNVQPKSITVKEGGRAFIECNVSNRCNIHFHWTLDERVVLNTTRRYQNGSNLIINRVNRTEDVGNFHCVATFATIARESQPAQLSIMWLNENASVVLESPASTVEANAGGAEELRLRCVAEGSDELEYSWFYNGRQVKRAERIEIKAEYLTVRKPTAADNGIYSCKVENTAGLVSSQHNFALIIQEDGMPSIATLPEDVIAPLGATVRLNCAYHNASQVKWRRVSSNTNKALSSLSPLSTQMNNGSLVIPSVTLADQGAYECLGFGESAKIQQAYVAQLTLANIKDFGESSFEPVKHLYAVGHGKRFEVACAPPAGFPEPIAYWTREGRRLSSSGRVRSEGLQLVIDEAGSADGGKYVCVAENMAGRKEGVLSLVLTTPPKISRHPGSKEPLEGQDVFFDCKAEATSYPATTIDWEKDGEPLRAPSPRSLEPNRIQWNVENGSLSILNVQLHDEGQYTCVVTTEGQDPVRSKVAQLHVRESLKFNPKPVDRKFEMGIDARVTCSATGEVPPMIKWMQTKKLDLDGNVTEDYKPPKSAFPDNIRSHNGTLYFRGITFEDAGVYVCAAVSKQGVIQEEIRVEVYVAPTYVKSPDNRTVSEKKDVFYDCLATGTPTPHVHWYFEGIALDEPPKKLPFHNFEIFPNNTLVIRQTTLENAGKYMCMAGNKGGIRRSEALLCIHLKTTNFTHCGRQIGLNPATFGVSDGVDSNGVSGAQGIGPKTLGIACGVAVGYIVLVMCLLACCGYCRRRSTDKVPPLQVQADHTNGVRDPLMGTAPRSLPPESANGHPGSLDRHSTPMVPLQRQSPRSSSSKTTGATGLDRFALARDRLDTEWNPLGAGVFGGVFLAKAYGVKHGEDISYVLIKTLTAKDDHLHQLFKEEMDLFAKSNHENVAGLLGVCREQEPILMLLDYLEWGNVKHYMVWSRNRSEGPSPLTEAQIVSIAYQVAQGMEHISDQRFVHKDLAARNILVGPGIADPSMRSQPLTVKISSLSLQEDTFMLEYHTYRNQVLPVRWLAPEVLADDDYSMKSDVWGFGVLLWELFSCGEMPYQMLSNDDVIREVQSARLTLDVRDSAPDAAADLMRSCWQADPRQRPTFTDIRDVTGQLHVETGL